VIDGPTNAGLVGRLTREAVSVTDGDLVTLERESL